MKVSFPILTYYFVKKGVVTKTGLIKFYLGHSLLMPCSSSDARMLFFNANFSACKLIIDWKYSFFSCFFVLFVLNVIVFAYNRLK